MKQHQPEHLAKGANIAGAPIDEPPLNGGSMTEPEPYIPRHLASEEQKRTAKPARNALYTEGAPSDNAQSSAGGAADHGVIPNGTDVPIPGGGWGNAIPQPDGSTVAPNGAVIRHPWSDQPEILPDHEYTPEKEDLNLLIM